MEVKWTESGHRDLMRLHEFLASVSKRSAQRALQQIVREAKLLQDHPLIGSVLYVYAPREVRSVIIGEYELRYEVTVTSLYVLRIWHTKEDRIG